jgi:hypothetical protein
MDKRERERESKKIWCSTNCEIHYGVETVNDSLVFRCNFPQKSGFSHHIDAEARKMECESERDEGSAWLKRIAHFELKFNFNLLQDDLPNIKCIRIMDADVDFRGERERKNFFFFFLIKTREERK